MSSAATIFVLFLAAALEAGGDALVRTGMQRNILGQRVALFVVAAMVLFAYGWTVNAPPWDFGKLIGVYVVFFFVIAQLISWLIFRHTPSVTVLLGGALIIAGGLVVSTAKG
jgi:drug/metabolite transporter superfamily protein YnfA